MTDNDNIIQVCRPTIDDETIADLVVTLKSGWFGCGPKTAEFEKALAAYTGRKFAIGTNSGTSALQLALRVYDIEGGTLITTPMTFTSDAHVGEERDMEVVFADIDPETLCLDPKTLHKYLTKDTKAIIVVDSHGRVADYKGIRKACQDFGINPLIIEDAAHAMFAEGVGQDSDITMLSFQAVKTMPSPDGGALLTDDEKIAKELHKLKWLNVEKTTYDRSLGRKYTWDYEITRGDGIKAYMNDVVATMLLGQLRRLGEMLAKRRTIQTRYNEAFKDIPEIKAPAWSETVQYYTMQCDSRDQLSEHLAEKGIITSVHFKPLNFMPYWKKCEKVELPVNNTVWKRLLSIPCHDALTFTQLEYVIKNVREFYGK